jgi:hypothetical protein
MGGDVEFMSARNDDSDCCGASLVGQPWFFFRPMSRDCLNHEVVVASREMLRAGVIETEKSGHVRHV